MKKLFFILFTASPLFAMDIQEIPTCNQIAYLRKKLAFEAEMKKEEFPKVEIITKVADCSGETPTYEKTYRWKATENASIRIKYTEKNPRYFLGHADTVDSPITANPPEKIICRKPEINKVIRIGADGFQILLRNNEASVKKNTHFKIAKTITLQSLTYHRDWSDFLPCEKDSPLTCSLLFKLSKDLSMLGIKFLNSRKAKTAFIKIIDLDN